MNLGADSAVGRHQAGLRGGISLTHLLIQETANAGRVQIAQQSGNKHARPDLIDLQPKGETNGFRHKPTAVSREELDRRLGWVDGKRVSDTNVAASDGTLSDE